MEFNLGLDKIGTVGFWRAIAAEFVGCTFFLLCVTTVCLKWSVKDVDVSANNVEIGIGIGLAIASLAQAFGHVSGGHLNPAVTFGMIIANKISIIQGILYIVAQVIGGIVGSALTYACTPKVIRDAVKLGCTNLNPLVRQEQGFGLELLFTFLLVFFIFSITDPAKKTEPYGTTLGIGVVIWVAHVCLIPITGCGINPARSFGPAVVYDFWDNHWIYWVGPFLGGALAAIAYKFIFYVEEDKYEATAQDIVLTGSSSPQV